MSNKNILIYWFLLTFGISFNCTSQYKVNLSYVYYYGPRPNEYKDPFIISSSVKLLTPTETKAINRGSSEIDLIPVNTDELGTDSYRDLQVFYTNSIPTKIQSNISLDYLFPDEVVRTASHEVSIISYKQVIYGSLMTGPALPFICDVEFYCKLEIFPFYKIASTPFIGCNDYIQLGLTNSEFYDGTIKLQVRPRTETNWSNTFSLSVGSSTLNIAYSELPNDYILNQPTDFWYNKELEFRVVHPDGIPDPEFKGGFFFLNTPAITFPKEKQTQPKCAESNDAKIGILFPDLPSGANYRLSIGRYAPGSNSSDDKITINDTIFYFVDGVTEVGTQREKVLSNTPTLITVDQTYINELYPKDNLQDGEKKLELKAGLYKFIVSTQTGSAGDLCAYTYYHRVIPPDPIDIVLKSNLITGSDTYHTRVNGGTGSVIVTPSGGKAGCTYKYKVKDSGSWKNLPTNQIVDNVSHGDTIYLSNDASCLADYAVVTFKQPDLLEITTVTSTLPTCHSSNSKTDAGSYTDGSISFKCTGGIPSYTITLQKKNSSNVFAKTDYTHTFTDDGLYKFSNLPQGDYKIVLADAYSNTIESLIPLNPTEIVASNPDPIELNCNGNKTTIDLPGNLPSTYVLKYAKTPDTPNTTFTENTTTLGYGIYTIRVANSNEKCYKDVTATISEPPLLQITNLSQTADICNNEDGSVTFDIEGGTKDAYPYYITIIDSKKVLKEITIYKGTPLINIQQPDLPAEDYTITVYSRFDKPVQDRCSASDTFKIVHYNPLEQIGYNKSKTVVESCPGKGDASITLTNLDKITESYTFTPANKLNPIDSVVSGLSAGTDNIIYIVETGTRKCTRTIDIIEAELVNPNPLSFVGKGYADTDATCDGAKNGKLTINAIGSFDIVSYSISGPSTAADSTGAFSGILSGNYTITVTDSKNCTIKAPATVKAKLNIITADKPIATDATCSTSNNGTIELKNIKYSGNTTLELWLDKTKQTGYSGLSSHTIHGLAPQTSTVILKDADGCQWTDTSTVGNQGKKPTVTAKTVEELACTTAKNGQLEITASATYINNPILTYKIAGQTPSEASTTSGMLYSKMTNAPYTITVTDNLNCSSELKDTVPIMAQTVALSDPIVHKASCDSAYNGTITVTGTQGKQFADGYVFTVDGKTQRGFTTTFKGLKASTTKTYSISIADSAGCLATKTTKVNVIATPFKITGKTTTPPKCLGDENGALSLTADDWIAGLPYTYTLKDPINGTNYSGNISDTIINSIKGGTYDLVMVSAKGCTSSYPSIEIKDPKPMTVDSVIQRVLVKGEATGRIDMILSDGSGTYSYEFTDILQKTSTGETATSPLSFPNLPAGIYQLKVGDKNQCKYFTDIDGKPAPWHTQTITVKEPAQALGLSVVKKDITCNASKDGFIEVTGVGGWHDYNYYMYRKAPSGTWQTNSRFDIDKKGTYTIEVKDIVIEKVDHITASVEVTIDEPLPFSLTAPITKDATCVGLDNGWVKTTPINGIPSATGFTYKLLTDKGVEEDTKDVAGNYHYGKLPKGTYQLQVIDSHQCTFTTPLFSIGQPAPITTTKSNNYIRRFGDASGQFAATLAGGSNYFAYNLYKDNQPVAIDKGFTTGQVAKTGLSAGIYRLEIKDTANCNYGGAEWMAHTFDIKQPSAALTLDTVRVDPVKCYAQSNGNIDIAATGGWGDYRYSLNNGGYATKWAYSGMQAGTYTFTARDSAGIEAPLVVELKQPDALSAAIKAIEHIKCNGDSTGSIALNIVGGNGGYRVSTDNKTFVSGSLANNLKAGSYTVTVDDKKGCTTNTPVQTITQPDKVTNTSLALTKSRCKNREGAIQATFAGGTGSLSYQWGYNDGGVKLDSVAFYAEVPTFKTPSIARLYSGGYNLLVTDANNCPYAFNYSIDDISDLTISQIVTDSVTCHGKADGSAVATVVAGNAPYTYTWNAQITNHANERAWNLAAGGYILSVADSKHCRITRTFTIPTPDPLAYQTNSLVQPLCLGGPGGIIDITATGGSPSYTYLWNTGETTVSRSNLAPGIHTLTLTDSHNCSAQFGFAFSYQRTIKPNLGDDANICHYQSLPLDGGNFKSFDWRSNNGFSATSRQVTLTDAGTYRLNVADADNCTGADTLQLNVSQLAITGHQKTDVDCNGAGNGAAQIEVGPANWAHRVLWSNKSTDHQIANLSGGTYKAMVFDDYNCSDTLELTINEPAALALTSRVADPLCWGVSDGLIDVTPSGGVGNYQTNWSHGATKARLNNLDQGIYNLTLTDGNGCKLAQTFDLKYQRAIYPQLGADRVVCAGNQVKLYPGWFIGYKWLENNQTISTDTALVVGKTSTVSVQVTDNSGCLGTDQINITQTPTTFSPLFLMASSVEAGDTLLLVEVSQPKPISHSWSFGLAHRVVEQSDYACKVIFDETGTDEVKLTATNGDCTGESWKTLLVLPDTGNSESPGTQTYGTKFVSFTVTPNPSDGHFNATLKFKEKQDVTLYLVNISTGQMVETRKVKGTDTYNESFNNSLTPGHYALFAETALERRVAKLVVR